MEILVFVIGFIMLLILIPFYRSPIYCLVGIIIGCFLGVSISRIAMKDIEMRGFGLIIHLIGGVIMGAIVGFITSQIGQAGP